MNDFLSNLDIRINNASINKRLQSDAEPFVTEISYYSSNVRYKLNVQLFSSFKLDQSIVEKFIKISIFLSACLHFPSAPRFLNGSLDRHHGRPLHLFCLRSSDHCLDDIMQFLSKSNNHRKLQTGPKTNEIWKRGKKHVDTKSQVWRNMKMKNVKNNLMSQRFFESNV